MVMSRMQFEIIFLILCVGIFNCTGAELCRGSETPANDLCDSKFCPFERIVDGKRNKCVSHKFQYKCGVFYKNLPDRMNPDGKFEPLTFIGSFPDVLNKPKIQNSQEFRTYFGDLKRKQFRIKSICKETSDIANKVADERCYAAMSKTRMIWLDLCTNTYGTEDGSQTIGDLLCDNIDTLYENGYFKKDEAPDSVDDIDISFQYSACGKPWTQVMNNTKLPNGIETSAPLLAPEKLCCRRAGGKLRFRRCAGTAFNSECNN